MDSNSAASKKDKRTTPANAPLSVYLSKRYEFSTPDDCDKAMDMGLEIAAGIRAAQSAAPVPQTAPTNAATTVRRLKEALNHIVLQSPSYDWNADPQYLTLVVGKANKCADDFLAALPSEQEEGWVKVLRLLNRVLRGVREFEPNKKACCALWHGPSDSDGCGVCFKCFEADLVDAIKALPAPPERTK